MGELPSYLLNGRRSELDLPWYPDDGRGEDERSVIADWSLYRYLSDGGIRVFATTSIRATVRHRQNRFLCICGALAVLWLIFLLV